MFVTQMRNKVLIINGATRINGNTDTLIRRVIEGAEGSRIGLKLINLRDKNIGNCAGCYQCLNDGICSLKDDMTEIRDDMQEANLLIFASPLYWCGVTGLMKTFIDRLFFYYHPKTKNKISGKKVITITPMNQKNVRHESEVLVEFYSRLFNCLGVRPIKMVFWGNVMGMDAVLNKRQYLKAAYNIGRDLLKLADRCGDSFHKPQIQVIK